MANTIRVPCRLTDCAHYGPVPHDPAFCECSHSDKPRYMAQPCPLYRKDWNKKSSDAEATGVLDKFRPKKRL